MPLGTGGAVRYAGDSLTESVVVFNGDVLTQVDLGAVLRLHRERKAKATIVLTPVDNPRAYGLVETDADGNIQRFLEKPGEDEITCNTINAGIYVLEPDTFDRIPKDTAWSIERSYFPSLIERGETFVAYVVRRVLDRHRHAGEVPAGPPRHHGRPLSGAAVRRRAARDRVGRRPTRKVEEGVELQGPCFVDEGVVLKAGARVLPYSVIGRQTHVDEGAVIDGSIIWPNGWIGREAIVRGSILGRNCHVGRNAVVDTPVVLGDKTVITDYSRYEHQSRPSTPRSSRRTTFAASTRPRSTRTAARLIGRGFVALPRRQAHRRVARHAAVVAVGRGGVHRRRARAGRRRRRLRHDGRPT